MYKTILMLMCFSLNAQVNDNSYAGNQNSQPYKYVSLEDHKVFDVEIIVFAYKTPLPNINTYNNKGMFTHSDAYLLSPQPVRLGLIKTANTNVQKTQDSKDYSIPLEDSKNKQLALVWFEHPKSAHQLNKIWGKLQNQQNIIPLIHKSWRQPETPFEEPQFVQVSTMQEVDSTDGRYIPDYTITGKVALSKGRYMHFGHKLNLWRKINSDQVEPSSMIFALTERKQVRSGELHYFDSPWFGSIVKITQFTGENKNQGTNDD